jgi:hypothetical protein
MVYGFLEDPMIEIASFDWLSGVLGLVWRTGATAIAFAGFVFTRDIVQRFTVVLATR